MAMSRLLLLLIAFVLCGLITWGAAVTDQKALGALGVLLVALAYDALRRQWARP